MLGFPLTEERKTPKLSEKIFVAQDGDVNIYRLTFLFFGKVKFYAMYFEQVENPDRKPLVIGLHGGEGTETIFLTQNFMCEKTSARLKDDFFIELSENFSKVQNDGILKEYMNAAKELCKKYGVKVCDLYPVWEKLKESGADVTELLANKLNHPVREYHYYIAIKLIETILGI